MRQIENRIFISFIFLKILSFSNVYELWLVLKQFVCSYNLINIVDLYGTRDLGVQTIYGMRKAQLRILEKLLEFNSQKNKGTAL